MKEGLTNKERYYSLVKKIKDSIEDKKKSISLADNAIDDNNLRCVYGVTDSLRKAINENEIAINTLYELLEYADSLTEESNI